MSKLPIQKFKSGEITGSLFAGLLNLANGGTGLTNVQSHRIISLASSSLNASSNMYLDDDLNVGIYDEYSLIPIERDFSSKLEIGSLTASADIRIKDNGPNSIQITAENTLIDISFELKNSGEFVIDDGNGALYLHSPSVLSLSLSNSQNQFDLGMAITVGNSINSAPDGGAFEYNGANFRFVMGPNWKIVSTEGVDIGQPIALEVINWILKMYLLVTFRTLHLPLVNHWFYQLISLM